MTNPLSEAAVELAANRLQAFIRDHSLGELDAIGEGKSPDAARRMAIAALTATLPAIREAVVGEDTKRLDYIERTFSGMTNRERYLPVQMIWGKGCNGRTLREACDKYMARDAAALTEQENRNDLERSHDGG